MASVAARLAEGEARTAAICLVFMIGSLLLGVGFVCVGIFLPLEGIAAKAIWGLVGSLLMGVGLMIRGLHREATRNHFRWRGVVDAYAAPKTTRALVQQLDAIVMRYLEMEVRNASRRRRRSAPR